MNRLFFSVGGILDSANMNEANFPEKLTERGDLHAFQTRFVSECLHSRLCSSLPSSFRAAPPSGPPPFPSPREDYSRSCCPLQSAAISANGPPYVVFTSGFRCLEDIKYFVPQLKWRLWQTKNSRTLRALPKFLNKRCFVKYVGAFVSLMCVFF